MRLLLKISKYFLFSVVILALVYLFLFAIFVIPNDSRLNSPYFEFKPLGEQKYIAYNLIEQSGTAQITHRDYGTKAAALKNYPYLNDNRDFHVVAENIHLSLGWYPLKMVHKNCLYAPAPTTISYQLTVPKNEPRLIFSAGVLDKVAAFQVKVRAKSGRVKVLFSESLKPLSKYSYSYENKFYRAFYQYLNVQMEDRDNRWSDYTVDLSSFSGQQIELRLETTGNQAQAFWANPMIVASTANTEPKYNFIFVVMDSLRRDAVGLKDNKNSSFTPNIDKLTSTGVSFEKHLANGNMTKQSVTSFLTSRLPYELGDVSLEYVASSQSRQQFYQHKFATLAGQLKKQGYLTAAIGVISLFTDGGGFGVDFGFDDARIMERYGYSNVHITNEAIKWLNQFGQMPFALLVYYDSPHGPYKPPWRYLWRTRSLLGEWDAQSWYKTLYEAEVVYNDVYFGKLYQAMEDLGLKDNTLIVLTSDHAENLDWHDLPEGDKQVIFHDHGISVKDVDVQVPLIFNFPAKITTPHQIYQTTEHLDLAPTVLDLLNLPPCPEFRGSSLAGLIAGEKSGETAKTIFMRGRFNKGIRVADRYKYIRNFGVYEKKDKIMQEFVPEELYDLLQDPHESYNIINQDFVLRERMRLLLDSYEPDQDLNVFTLSNMGAKIAFLTIQTNSSFVAPTVEGNGKIIINGNKLTVTATGKKAVLKFETNPTNASLRVSAQYDGQDFPLAKILVSSYGLPLLDKNQPLIGGGEFYLIKGGQNYATEIGSPRFAGEAGNNFSLNWARVSQSRQEWEKQAGVSGVFKEMLSEWGYLSEAKQK